MKQPIIYGLDGQPLKQELAGQALNEKPKAQPRANQVDTYTFEELVKYAMKKVSYLPTNQNTSYGQEPRLTRYKQSEVREIVKDFKKEINQHKIVDISKQLYATSTQYRRLINHFSGMIKFAPVITPTRDLKHSKISADVIKDQYQRIGMDIRRFNMSSELRKFYRIALIEDVAYGWIHESDDSFFIQTFDYNMCRISSIEEGVYNFALNMEVFETDETKLQFMPKQVAKLYHSWKRRRAKDRNVLKWQELPSNQTICIKVSDEMLETFPFFAGVFDSIYDVETYKQLRKDSAELANYMAIVQQLPIRESSDNNDFTIDAQMYTYFNQTIQNVVPEQVGVFTTPMKVDTIKFDNKQAGDEVEKANRNVWNDSGVSSILFNSDASTTTQGIANSIKTDEEIVFSTLTQFESWINRYLKYKYKSSLIFNVSLIPMTVFSQKEVYDMYLTAGQYGVPVKSHIASIIGLEPIEVMSMAYLENDVLEMHKEFIPLQSSHTQSGNGETAETSTDDPNNEGGRPALPENERSEETQRNDDKPSVNPS